MVVVGPKIRIKIYFEIKSTKIFVFFKNLLFLHKCFGWSGGFYMGLFSLFPRGCLLWSALPLFDI